MKTEKGAKAKTEGKEVKTKSSADKHSAGHSSGGKQTEKSTKKK
jgi:hypothetical protein